MDIVMFMGGTGSGKSVSVNYFLGHKLESYKNYGRTYLRLSDENLKEGTYAKIGQAIGTSETTFINGYNFKDSTEKSHQYEKLTLCDCPGFEDTRGELHDLITMLSIDNTIINARSVRCIVLTLPYDDIWSSRGRLVMDLFSQLGKKIPVIFTTNDTNILNSVYLLITKYNRDPIFDNIFSQAVNDALSTESGTPSEPEQDGQRDSG
jgi:hypothetical protein